MGHFLRHPYLRLANTAASGSDWSQMAWCRSGWDQGPETLTVPQFPPLRMEKNNNTYLRGLL